MFEEDAESKFFRYAGIAIAVAAALWIGSYIIRNAQNTADQAAIEDAIKALPKPPNY